MFIYTVCSLYRYCVVSKTYSPDCRYSNSHHFLLRESRDLIGMYMTLFKGGLSLKVKNSHIHLYFIATKYL